MFKFKKTIFVFLSIILLAACVSQHHTDVMAQIQSNFAVFEKQTDFMLDQLANNDRNPRTVENGETKLVKSSDWTSGFFPGNLWNLYEYTRDEKWKDAADHFTMNIEKEKLNGRTHDMGFKMFCSFGNGYRLSSDPAYKTILLQSAKTLSTRFNPKVGCIRSWDHNSDKWDYPVIIDNMLNLELLFWASRETRDSSFYKIAVSHAETTMKNHFRDDYSCYHVVSYDTISGEPVIKGTHQGYSDESAWARGQAWGLYGFTMVYRETGDQRFLDQANRIAEFILNHPRLPKDGIPYWDFDAPGIPDEPRDASAAAVIASALYELGLYVDVETQQTYFNAADHILISLSSKKYLAKVGENHGFLLKHSVGSMPGNSEIDVPLIYADYYFLEANLRRMKIQGNWAGEKAAVIFKVDDLVVNGEGEVPVQWQNFAALVEKKQIPVAAGIVGSSLEKGKDSFFNWIKKYNETGLFEFWNHGQLHQRDEVNGEKRAEFYNRSIEEQVAFLKQTQDLAMEKLGFQLSTFGSPYNWCDENTSLALKQFPEIGVWFYPPKEVQTDLVKLERIPALNIEYPVHHANFYHFFNSYYFYSNLSVVTIQGHPMSWHSYELNQVELMMNYLKACNVEVIKPSTLMGQTKTKL
ncbi:MAG: glycoside hydrolase family 88 protein [Prolixibacteraceae bacterium]